MKQIQNNQTKQLKNQRTHSQEKTELTFLEHLYELRTRLFWVVFTLIAASAIGFQVKDALIDIVMAPLKGEQLVYLTPGGGFGFIFTLSIYFGALLAIPVFVYHIYRFLQPLLHHTSRKFIAVFITLSALLATTGALFGYFVAIPSALNFLTTFAGDAVIPNLTADSYLGFVVAYVLGLAALFQIPLLLFLVDHIRPIPPGGLSSTQRFVVIGATVAAAIITPTPDALNMAIIAVPIIAVYEVGAFVVFLRHQVRKRKVAHAARKLVRQEQLLQDTPLQRQVVQQAQKEEQEVPMRPIPIPVHIVPQMEQSKPVFVVRKRPPQPQPQVRRRTMDGFVVRKRPTPMAGTIHKKPDQQVHPAAIPSPRVVPRRPMRSIDGFSPA